jgi:hypothetical protein
MMAAWELAPTSWPSSTSTCAANRKRCLTGRQHVIPRSRSLSRRLMLAHSAPAKAGARRCLRPTEKTSTHNAVRWLPG